MIRVEEAREETFNFITTLSSCAFGSPEDKAFLLRTRDLLLNAERTADAMAKLERCSGK